jgi:hypothetical protein
MITNTPIMTPMMPLFTLPPLSSVVSNTPSPGVHEANLAEIADACGYSPQVPWITCGTTNVRYDNRASLTQHEVQRRLHRSLLHSQRRPSPI